ncbi:MAG: glycosyltransferase family 2 protein [Vibrionaceae bacterium]|nr:glycosyltransferase family 2 protein [Vibrionaceae bacterium]
MLTINVLISTLNDGIERLMSGRFPEDEAVKYIVVHQVKDGYVLKGNIEKWLESRADFLYYRSNDTGLSKSRNFALSKSSSDIVIFCDDDVSYVNDAFDIIKNSFDKNKKIDIATFKVKTLTGFDFKKYNSEGFRHTNKTIFKVSSIEVAAKRESIMSKEIKFDERFGLGTQLPASEENIFLLDCLKKGLNLNYFPNAINIHPMESSGRDWDNPKMRSSKLSFMYRCFNAIGFFVFLLFAIKKYPEYRKSVSFFSFCKENIDVFLNFYRNKN